ncbi:sulfotransferase 1C4-like [Diadema antillarum]|uniref:sulfotransferase 1C4-like n=1 Tax=Diadema antillarum TaxID=105358 RepID=UPI003A83CEF9
MFSRYASTADDKERPHIFRFHRYQGVSYPNVLLDASIDALKTFEVRPDDVWIASFPKSGSHWMIEIVSLIHARGIPENMDRSITGSKVEMINLQQRFPLSCKEEHTSPVDMTPHLDKVAIPASPRIIPTHLKIDLLPPHLLQTGKVIYVARNPKDLAASFFHFFGNSLSGNFTLEAAVQGFINDEVPFGPWFSHVQGYWNIRHERNVLFLLYEDMKKNPVHSVRQVAEHLGVDLSDDELRSVVDYSSFSGMKKTYDAIEQVKGEYVTKLYGKLSYMYKGQVGTWKGCLTMAQSEMMDEWIQDKTSGTDISFQYE